MSERKRVSHPTGGDRIVQSQFAHNASVGDLVARHRLGASLTDPFATRQPIWGDFTAVSFQQYQDALLDVQRTFASLPAHIRRHFGNNPYQVFRLLDQVRDGDPSAIQLAKKLDIIIDAPTPPVTPPPANSADPESNPHKDAK